MFYYTFLRLFNQSLSGAIMTTAECRKPAVVTIEAGEDNSKFEPKKLRKVQIHQYGQTKDCYRGFQAR